MLFYEGNGRTGRILNILYLVLNNLIDSPILYLLRGIEITSKDTIQLIKSIQLEMNNYKAELKLLAK